MARVSVVEAVIVAETTGGVILVDIVYRRNMSISMGWVKWVGFWEDISLVRRAAPSAEKRSGSYIDLFSRGIFPVRKSWYCSTFGLFQNKFSSKSKFEKRLIITA